MGQCSESDRSNVDRDFIGGTWPEVDDDVFVMEQGAMKLFGIIPNTLNLYLHDTVLVGRQYENTYILLHMHRVIDVLSIFKLDRYQGIRKRRPGEVKRAAARIFVADSENVEDEALRYYDFIQSEKAKRFSNFTFPDEYEFEHVEKPYTIATKVVFYLRNVKMTYDPSIWNAKWNYGNKKYVADYKKEAYRKIAEKYPKYAEECTLHGEWVDNVIKNKIGIHLDFNKDLNSYVLRESEINTKMY